jgi:hypothetical protein
MADYQLRLAEETKEKIIRLDVDGQSVRASSALLKRIAPSQR